MSEQKFEFDCLWHIQIEHTEGNGEDGTPIPLTLDVVNRFQAERLLEYLAKWDPDRKHVKSWP